MKKFRSFLNQTSEITNKERLILLGCTLDLMGIGYWRYYDEYKAEMEKEDLEIELNNLKNKLKEKSINI